MWLDEKILAFSGLMIVLTYVIITLILIMNKLVSSGDTGL